MHLKKLLSEIVSMSGGEYTVLWSTVQRACRSAPLYVVGVMNLSLMELQDPHCVRGWEVLSMMDASLVMFLC